MPWNKVMGKFARGSLHSGSGKKVMDRDQALAIMYSEKDKTSKGKKEYQSKGMGSKFKKAA